MLIIPPSEPKSAASLISDEIARLEERLELLKNALVSQEKYLVQHQQAMAHTRNEIQTVAATLEKLGADRKTLAGSTNGKRTVR
jgi:chromosome segregation ATPase